jgi:hypothetical protein
MPRYFLNIRDESGAVAPDGSGAMYSDLVAARRAATSSAWEMMAESMKFHGRWAARRSFEITDERGALVATIYFADTVRDDASE